MLMRWDPFRDFDRLNEQLWRNGGRAPAAANTFPMDAYRRGDRFFVHFDLPGVDPDGIELTVEKNVLTVKVDRQWQPQEGDEVLAVERPRGTFTRQLFLGDTLDAGQLEASYDKGVLTLTIPVAEAAKPRKVQVTAGSSPEATAIEAEHTSTAAA
jgi:HSP20 family protein